MNLVLASDSPRRKHLLKFLVEDFRVISHQVKEEAEEYSSSKAEDLVGQLALDKAESVFSDQRLASSLIIGSDLTVSLGEKIMGKPKNENEAKYFLRNLSGKTHIVYCGVAVGNKDKILMSVAQSEVKMKNYSEEIIDKYVNLFQVLDKGGAYAIQFKLPDYGSLVENFKGGITTIIGLPLEYTANLLKEFGVKVKSDWRKKCKIETGYEY